MKNLFTKLLTLSFLGLMSLAPTNAQIVDLGDNLPSNVIEVCGAEITVYCDGSIDFSLNKAYEDQIFRIFQGGTVEFDVNTYTNTNTNFIGGTFNSNSLPANIDISSGGPWYVFFDNPCFQGTKSISDILADACPPTIEYCGATWEVNCDGSLIVDLTNAQGIQIYKVFNGGNVVNEPPFGPVEFNNYDTNPFNDVPYIKFSTGPGNGLPQFGNPIPKGENYYVYVNSTCDPSDVIINFSRILERYCSEYNPNSPNFMPLVASNNDYTFKNNEVITKTVTQEIANKNALTSNFAGSKKIEATVYPNPVDDVLNINLPVMDEEYSIQVYNVNGQLISETLNSGGSIQMNMKEMDKGLYFLKIQNGEFSKVEKIQVLR